MGTISDVGLTDIASDDPSFCFSVTIYAPFAERLKQKLIIK